MVTSNLYIHLVQKNLCYQYARHQDYPDAEYLQFTDVVIATGQFRGHECRFTDTRTSYPITISFAQSDIPYFTDTMQVLVGMMLPFVCFMVFGTITVERIFGKIYQKRNHPK